MFKKTNTIGRFEGVSKKVTDPAFLGYEFAGNPSKMNGIWTVSPMIVDEKSITSGQVIRLSTGRAANEILRRSTVQQITWEIRAEIFNPSTFTRVNDLGVRFQLANSTDGTTQNTPAFTKEANLTATEAVNTVSASGVITKAQIDGMSNEFMKVVAAGADNALSASNNQSVSGYVLIQLVE